MDQNRPAIAQVKQFGLGKEKTHNSEKGSKRMPKLMRSLHLNTTRPKQDEHSITATSRLPNRLNSAARSSTARASTMRSYHLWQSR